MARKKSLTRSGLPQFLSSSLRTVKLKELAEKRGKRLQILRKYIEKICSENAENLAKMSVDEFSKSIEIKPGTLSRLERGESCLSIEVADWLSVKVLKKYGVFVTSEWILGECNSLDIPRVINKNPFDIYSYLKDIYKASELSSRLTEEERFLAKESYIQLESSNDFPITLEVKALFSKYQKDLMSEIECSILESVYEKSEVSTLLSNKDSSFLKDIFRRLIISSDISDNEKSTRLVLASYFMADLFQKINPNSEITYVRDNQMAPVFFKGEVVGGTLVSMRSLSSADKRECIVKLKNSTKILRVFHYISNNTVILSTTSNENRPEIYSIDDIESVSVVSFRYANIERDHTAFVDIGSDTPNLIKFEDIKM